MFIPRITTVKPLTRIRRERLLPQAGEVVVNIGQRVLPVHVVARSSRSRGCTIVPAADILGVPPQDVPKYLLVEEGAAIQKKKPLLRRKSLLGSKEYISPVNGILYQVGNGRLILQQTPDLLELRAMLQGIVSGYIGNRGVVIETYGVLIEAMWGSDREGYGTIKVVARTSDEPLRSKHINADVRGSVLVAGYIDQVRVLEEAEGNSVRGVIVGSISAEHLPALAAFRFPIIVTEGFCGQPMAQPIFELLRQSEGREASLFGMTTNTGSRPEIIIPMPATQAPEQTDNMTHPLSVGERVRILRAPYGGAVGKVVSVHARSRATSVGYRIAGAEVALANGQLVFVPYPNLDVIR